MRMTLKRIMIVALIVLMVLSATACGLLPSDNRPKKESDAEHNSQLPISSETQSSSFEASSKDPILNAISTEEQQFRGEDGYVAPEEAAAAIDAVYLAVADLPGVVDCDKDENGVFIEMNSGLDYVYVPELKEYDVDGNELNIVTLQPYVTENRAYDNTMDHDALDVCAYDLSAYDSRWSFVNRDNVDDDHVTMDRILDIDQSKMILWQGHGGYTRKSGYYLCTTIEVTDDLLAQYPGLTKDTAIIRSNGKLGLKAAFIQENYPDNAFENAFVYIATCESGRTKEFANAFVDKGAAVVFVNSRSILREYNLKMLHLIVESFCIGPSGSTTSNALRSLSGYSVNSPENWTIQDSLLLAQTCYGKKDKGFFGAEVYFLGQPGVERMTYSEWMGRFDLGESQESDYRDRQEYRLYKNFVEQIPCDTSFGSSEQYYLDRMNYSNVIRFLVLSQVAVIDIDGNGSPELLLGGTDPTGGDYFFIFTVQDNEVHFAETFVNDLPMDGTSSDVSLIVCRTKADKKQFVLSVGGFLNWDNSVTSFCAATVPGELIFDEDQYFAAHQKDDGTAENCSIGTRRVSYADYTAAYGAYMDTFDEIELIECTGIETDILASFETAISNYYSR